MVAERINAYDFGDSLIRANPILGPQELSREFPGLGYEHFTVRKNLLRVPEGEFQITIRHDLEGQIGVWDREDEIPRMHKVILNLATMSTGGKDATRLMLQRLHPSFATKVVTATSRPPRKDEQDGEDYLFYTREEFERAIKKDEFIEYVDLNQNSGQPPRYMGLPKKSLVQALMKSNPVVVCHVEMTHGWPAVDKWVQDSYQTKEAPVVFKAVIIPQVMPDRTFKRLTERIRRLRQDAEARIANAIKELWLAPQLADILITNKIPKDGDETGLIRTVTELMLMLKNINLYGLHSLPSP